MKNITFDSGYRSTISFCHSFAEEKGGFQALALSTGAVDAIGIIIANFDKNSDDGNFVEYDYVNKTKRVIPAGSIPDYAATTTTTYELPGMAEELPRLLAMMTATNGSVSPSAVVDPTKPFVRTAPKLSGAPNHPYSGVMYMMLGIDDNGDGIVDRIHGSRGTGFLVAPDVLVTAGHLIVSDPEAENKVVEIRIYPYVHSTVAPSVTYGEFIYPASWICYEYADAKNNNDQDAYKYDWCVMKLQEPVSGAYNFACSYVTEDLIGQGVIVSGYPGCVDLECVPSACTHSTYYQYASMGTITSVSSHHIFYSNNTKGGNSGGPVYLSSTYICYGIHAYGGTSANFGTKISVPIYNAISYYIESGG